MHKKTFFFTARLCREGHAKNQTPGPNNQVGAKGGVIKVRGCHGGVEKRGGWKTSRMTPLPRRGLGPPLVRYVFHPPQVSVLCFSCTKIHDRVDQKLFWRGPKIFGRARSLVRFPPPIRFAPPHITAQKGVLYKRKRTQTNASANADKTRFQASLKWVSNASKRRQTQTNVKSDFTPSYAPPSVAAQNKSHNMRNRVRQQQELM